MIKSQKKKNLLDTVYNMYTFFIIIFFGFIMGNILYGLTGNLYFKIPMSIGLLLPFFLIIFFKKDKRAEQKYGSVLVAYYLLFLIAALINLFACVYNSEQVVIDSISTIFYTIIGAFYSKKIWDAYKIIT